MLHVASFHEVGHTSDYVLHYGMCLLLFSHRRLYFCLPHQQAYILDESKMSQTIRLIFACIYFLLPNEEQYDLVQTLSVDQAAMI